MSITRAPTGGAAAIAKTRWHRVACLPCSASPPVTTRQPPHTHHREVGIFTLQPIAAPSYYDLGWFLSPFFSHKEKRQRQAACVYARCRHLRLHHYHSAGFGVRLWCCTSLLLERTLPSHPLSFPSSHNSLATLPRLFLPQYHRSLPSSKSPPQPFTSPQSQVLLTTLRATTVAPIHLPGPDEKK